MANNDINIDLLPPFNDFKALSPAIPQLYWDVYSQEQRWKELCKWIKKLVDYTDAINETLTDTIEQLEEFYKEYQEFVETTNTKIKSIEESIEAIKADILQFKADVEAFKVKTEEALKDLENSIETLDTKVEKYNNELNTKIEKYYQEINNSISEIKTDILQFKADMATFKTEVNNHFVSIETNIDEIETNIDEIETNIDEIETNIDEIETNIDNLKTRFNTHAKIVDGKTITEANGKATELTFGHVKTTKTGSSEEGYEEGVVATPYYVDMKTLDNNPLVYYRAYTNFTISANSRNSFGMLNYIDVDKIQEEELIPSGTNVQIHYREAPPDTSIYVYLQRNSEKENPVFVIINPNNKAYMCDIVVTIPKYCAIL